MTHLQSIEKAEVMLYDFSDQAACSLVASALGQFSAAADNQNFLSAPTMEEQPNFFLVIRINQPQQL